MGTPEMPKPFRSTTRQLFSIFPGLVTKGKKKGTRASRLEKSLRLQHDHVSDHVFHAKDEDLDEPFDASLLVLLYAYVSTRRDVAPCTTRQECDSPGKRWWACSNLLSFLLCFGSCLRP